MSENLLDDYPIKVIYYFLEIIYNIWHACLLTVFQI